MTLCDFAADPYNARYKIGWKECMLRQLVLNSHTCMYSEARHSLADNLRDIRDTTGVDMAIAIQHSHATPLRCELTHDGAVLHSMMAHSNVIEWILNGTPLPLAALSGEVRAKTALGFYEVDTGGRVEVAFTLFGMMLNTEVRKIVKTRLTACRISSTAFVEFRHHGVALGTVEPGLSLSPASYLHKPPLYLDRARISTRLDAVREELIAAALHPARLERYIFQGGDIDDF